MGVLSCDSIATGFMGKLEGDFDEIELSKVAAYSGFYIGSEQEEWSKLMR